MLPSLAFGECQCLLAGRFPNTGLIDLGQALVFIGSPVCSGLMLPVDPLCEFLYPSSWKWVVIAISELFFSQAHLRFCPVRFLIMEIIPIFFPS